MTFEQFGDIMDKFLEENHVRMVVDMPEGTQEVTIEDDIGLGPVIHFYILLLALTTTFHEFEEILNLERVDEFVDEMLRMVRDEILK